MSDNDLNGKKAATQAEVVLMVAKMMFPPGHPEILFAQWCVDNGGRLRAACLDLGIPLPQEGPGLIRRLKEAVMPVLEIREVGK